MVSAVDAYTEIFCMRPHMGKKDKEKGNFW
jgi:hypothetical protein